MTMQIPPSPLPIAQGIAPSYVWLPAGPWTTLLQFLAERFSAIDEASWESRMARGLVVNAEGMVMQPDAAYRPGMQVFYYRELADEPAVPFQEQILYQDDYLLVADKPHFLAVTPGGRFLRETLLVRLRLRTGLPDLTPIHRLDRETAGVVAFSVSRAHRDHYQRLFRDNAVEKTYEALAPLNAALRFPLVRESRIMRSERFFLMRETEGPPNARTEIELIGKCNVASSSGETGLYRLRPITGKTHQLRVHMNVLGIPILNDLLYPVAQPSGADDFQQPLRLLARSLAFTDPISGVRHQFNSLRRLDSDSQSSR